MSSRHGIVISWIRETPLLVGAVQIRVLILTVSARLKGACALVGDLFYSSGISAN